MSSLALVLFVGRTLYLDSCLFADAVLVGGGGGGLGNRKEDCVIQMSSVILPARFQSSMSCSLAAITLVLVLDKSISLLHLWDIAFFSRHTSSPPLSSSLSCTGTFKSNLLQVTFGSGNVEIPSLQLQFAVEENRPKGIKGMLHSHN